MREFEAIFLVRRAKTWQESISRLTGDTGRNKYNCLHFSEKESLKIFFLKADQKSTSLFSRNSIIVIYWRQKEMREKYVFSQKNHDTLMIIIFLKFSRERASAWNTSRIQEVLLLRSCFRETYVDNCQIWTKLRVKHHLFPHKCGAKIQKDLSVEKSKKTAFFSGSPKFASLFQKRFPPIDSDACKKEGK